MKPYSGFFAHIHTVIPASTAGGRFPGAPSDCWQPLIDIYEIDTGLVILVELPGVEKDEIKVEAVEGQLRISGHRRHSVPGPVRNVHHMEIPNGPFSRVVPLPPWAQAEAISAEYSAGYLTIHIARKAAK